MGKPFTQEQFAQLCGAVGVESARAQRVAAACESLFGQTSHLHGLTKTARPLVELAAALRMASLPGSLANALRDSIPALTASQRRIVLAAARPRRPRRSQGVTVTAQRAAEAEIAARAGAIAEVAAGVTCSGTRDATVAAALDDGEALELLVSGGRAARECVASVCARLDAWNATMPRAIRAAALYAGSRPPTGLPSAPTVAATARRILQTQWECFVSRLYGVRYRGDIEYVHELRVALRRLRAALRVFRKAVDGLVPVLRGELKRLADALGRVRDADVFLAFLGDYADKAPGEHQDFLRGLLRAERSKRRRHFRALLRLFESEDFVASTQRYGPVLAGGAAGLCPVPGAGDAPAGQGAPQALLKRLKAVKKRGRNLARATPDQQHTLRIQCKKLRYTAEFLADLYPKGLKAIIGPMVAMQDALGDVHDADVYRERIIRYHARRRAAAGDPQGAQAVDAVLAFLARWREESFGSALTTWRAFAKSKAPRKAAKAIL